MFSLKKSFTYCKALLVLAILSLLTVVQAAEEANNPSESLTDRIDSLTQNKKFNWALPFVLCIICMLVFFGLAISSFHNASYIQGTGFLCLASISGIVLVVRLFNHYYTI